MFEKFIENKKLGGVNCLLWKDGRVIYEESCGFKNMETLEPMGADTIFRIASMTKPITSVLAMMLYEEKKFSLSDPITKWFPQFGDMKVLRVKTDEYENAKRVITVDDLLTHRAGFTYSDFQSGKLRDDYNNSLGGEIDSPLSIEQWLDGLARLPLVSQPGELFNYGRSTDLLGILISTIEGKPLGKVMEEKIFRPLGMTDSFFYVPDEKKSRRAANIGFDESGGLMNLETVPAKMSFKERPHDMAFEAGSGGLWSTISDYLRFAKIFVEGGCSDGVHILRNDTLELMCSNQLTDYQREHSKLLGSAMFREYYGFGLGLAVVTKENTFNALPCSGSVGSVGWPGAFGGWWSADPKKKMISIFLTHSMTELHQLAKGIGFEMYEAIEKFANFCRMKTEFSGEAQ
jgi:CubicO group peptidase (beta-lactamase class C family)